MNEISLYPINEEPEEDRQPTTVRIGVSDRADIALMVELWAAMDEALERKRKHKWKQASVMEALIHKGIQGFWAQVGGRPSTAKAREKYIQEAIATLRAKFPEKK